MGVVSIKSQVLIPYFKITCSYIAVLLRSPGISEIIKNTSIGHSGQTLPFARTFKKGDVVLFLNTFDHLHTILGGQMAMLQICYTSMINCAVNVFVSVPHCLSY